MLATEYGRSFTQDISPALVRRWASCGNPDDLNSIHEQVADGGNAGHTLEEILAVDAVEVSEADMLKRVRLARVRNALHAIPDELGRQVMVMHHMEEKTYAQIAKALGISEGTVKTLERACRSDLADMVDDGGIDDPELWHSLDIDPKSGERARGRRRRTRRRSYSDSQIQSMVSATVPKPAPAPRLPSRTPVSLPDNDVSLLFADF